MKRLAPISPRLWSFFFFSFLSPTFIYLSRSPPRSRDSSSLPLPLILCGCSARGRRFMALAALAVFFIACFASLRLCFFWALTSMLLSLSFSFHPFTSPSIFNSICFHAHIFWLLSNSLTPSPLDIFPRARNTCSVCAHVRPHLVHRVVSGCHTSALADSH